MRGNPTTVQQWVSGSTYLSTTSYYDTTGQTTKVTDPAGNSTTYSYTDNFFTDHGASYPPPAYTPSAPTNAYQTQATLPISGALSYGYYFNTGQRAYSQDQNSNRTYASYADPFNRNVNTSLPNSGGQSITYTSATLTDIQTVITSGNNRHDQRGLDTLARPNMKSLVSDPQGTTTVNQTSYAAGPVATVTNPYRSTSDPTYGQDTLFYDGLHRVTMVSHTDSNYQTFYGAAVGGNGGATSQLCASGTYGVGFPVLAVDETLRMRQSWTDGLGRTIEVDEPDPGTGSLVNGTCYKYDLHDNLAEVDQGSETRTYTYDGLSRLLTSTTPEEGPSSSATGTTTYSYTTSGGALCSGNPQAVCRRTDARSITTTYAYDAENRLTSKTYTDGTPTVTYYYDQTGYNGLTITNGKGRRTGMSDGSGQTAWSYNTVGQVLNERRTLAGVTKTVSYAYNLDGTLSSLTYPGGNTVSFGYDTAQRPTSASDSFTTYANAVSYAPQGAIAFAYRNGVSNPESFTYDNRLRLKTLQVNNGSTLNLAYAYFANGNVSTITNNVDTGRTETFTYDYLNRLTSAQSQATSGADCWGQSIPSGGYDRYANLLTINSTQCSSPALSLSVSSKNRVTNSGFTYDNGGNETFDGLYSYTWDAESHLKSANGVNYTYDGDLRRVEKSNGKLYWYSTSGQVLEETDLSGNLVNDYIWVGGMRFARRDASGNVYYYLTDALGTTRGMLLNSNTTLCYDADFYPFGGEKVVTNTCAQNYKFTGLERDAESGLDKTVNRMYTSNLGRWLEPDPLRGSILNPQSLNRYAYVANNPPTLVDPKGTHFFAPCLSGWENCMGSVNAVVSGGGVATGITFNYGPGNQDPLTEAEARYLSIITTGWDPVLGINWNNVPPPQDPGCGPGVVAGINATIGAELGLTFSQVGEGKEVGGNWDYTLNTMQTGTLAWAQGIANQINTQQVPNLPMNVGTVFGPGTRAGGVTPSPHVHSAVPVETAPGSGVYYVQITEVHDDMFNPNSGLPGAVLHGAVDWAGGNILQLLRLSLGCH